jgi:hypothetical protein
MTHIGRGRAWAGAIFVAIAAGILLAEVGLHLYMSVTDHGYEPSHWIIFIAFVLGFAGWYTLSPKSAKDGGQFIVDNGIKVLQTIRLGRRKSDAMKIVNPTTEEIAIPLTVEPDPPGSPKRRVTDDQLPTPAAEGEGDEHTGNR